MGHITLEAPAKINLYLAVLARRPDGYHDIETLMLKLQLADVLRLQKGGQGISLRCPSSGLPEDETNLAHRAARAFLEKTGVSHGVEIILEKKIPVAAGLGGGSSDAAAVLCGLNTLFETGLETEALVDLAGTLGADVPFFVESNDIAWARGIGDRLQKAEPVMDCWIVLVNPGFPVSTKWVYENFALTTGGNPYILGRERQTERDPAPFLRNGIAKLFNDLESVTISRFPEVAAIKQELLADGARDALMSGSGPTVFGIFEDRDHAAGSRDKFFRRYGGNVFLTRPRQRK